MVLLRVLHSPDDVLSMVRREVLSTAVGSSGRLTWRHTAAAPAHISLWGSAIKHERPFRHEIKAQACCEYINSDMLCTDICIRAHTRVETMQHICSFPVCVCVSLVKNALYTCEGVIYASSVCLWACRLQMCRGQRRTALSVSDESRCGTPCSRGPETWWRVTLLFQLRLF